MPRRVGVPPTSARAPPEVTPQPRRGLVLLVAVVVLIVLAGIFFREPGTPLGAPPSAATASRSTASPSTASPSTSTVGVSELPREAQQVYRLLLASGPFEYSKDGTVFANREGLLPREHNGYYREFTVETPGSSDRGARRLVTGGCGRQTSTRPVRATACSTENPIYYTDDHYESFRQVR